MQVVYEDNHIIIVSKRSGEIVQGDKTGDEPLSETVKQYIKEKYQKPGNVFLGVVHRLDRPVSGLVVFAKTSKALSRLNNMFRDGEVHKTYWAIVKNMPRETEATLTHWIVRNEKQNKSYAYDHEVKNSKKAILKYKVIGHTDHYTLLEVNLMTGRHHQIRCQLAKMGCPIKGDLKYGSPRSNADGSISLLSHKIEFVHPFNIHAYEEVCEMGGDRCYYPIRAHIIVSCFALFASSTELGSKASCFLCFRIDRHGYFRRACTTRFPSQAGSGRRESTATCRFFEEQQKPCFKK